MFRHYQEDGLGSELRNLLDNAFRFAAYVIKPDGTLPTVGDTETDRVLDDPSFRVASGLRGYQEFRYSVTQGREGTAPTEPFRIFPKSGYAILRDGWEASGFTQSFYLLFKAGFLSLYHKHDDDLSFILYSQGEDWIIDSGLYRYVEDDPYRQYVRSARAHNVVVVDDLEAGRRSEDLGKSHIDEFEIETGGTKVRGSHTLYPGMEVSRELTYRRPQTIRIADHVMPRDGKEHTYRILFHVPADKTVKVTDQGALIWSTRTDATLLIKATEGNVRRVYTIAGQQKPEYQGWTSEKFGQIEKSICLCFEGTGKRWESAIELRFRSPSKGE